MAGQSERWISESRAALRAAEVDFFQVSPLVFWRDFLMSITVAYLAASLYLMSPTLSWQQLVAFPIAVFWLYRTGSLIHEVAHLGAKEMRPFKITWNLLAGVPMLTPSPFYSAHHRDHHSQRIFGTKQDPEYVSNCFRRGNLPSVLAYVGLVLVFPLLVVTRFILTPLTFLTPGLRTFVLTRLSSLMMNPHYVRRVTKTDRRRITIVEVLCCLRATAIPLGVVLGATHWTRVPMLYLLGVSVLVLNQLRLLADHHYDSDGDKLSFSEHLLDSCNYTGRDFLTWLLFPFSIRYHALHHLFPSLPYHNLAAANSYLLAELPVDSPYRQLEQAGWLSVASRTVGVSKQASAMPPDVTDDSGDGLYAGHVGASGARHSAAPAQLVAERPVVVLAGHREHAESRAGLLDRDPVARQQATQRAPIDDDAG